MITGRTVDVTKSPGGLALPDSMNNASVLALIDDVGPDVSAYKTGQLVLVQHMNHIYMRGGFHQLIFPDDEIWALVEDVDRKQLSIEGEEESGNGQPEARA
jgi:hypothetical protein